jgi:hypothetical protein
MVRLTFPIAIMGLALIGGLGPILGIFFQLYGPQGYGPSEIAFLLTLPSLCVGLGKLKPSYKKTSS